MLRFPFTAKSGFLTFLSCFGVIFVTIVFNSFFGSKTGAKREVFGGENEVKINIKK